MRLLHNILFLTLCGLLSAFHLVPDTPVTKNYKDDTQAKPFKHQPKDMLEDAIVTDSAEDPAATIAKLAPLPFLSLPHRDIATELDTCMQKQTGHSPLYIPVIQNITIGVEQISLVKNLFYLFKNFNKSPVRTCYEFAGDMSLLWRGNIRLGCTLGYSKYYSDKMQKNKYAYTCKGWYAGVGLGYLSHFNATNDIYIALTYNRSHFTNTAIDVQDHPVSAPKTLSASWSDIVLGVESRFLNTIPLYGGCALHVGWLYHYQSCKLAKNYAIPGYGLNVNKAFNLGLDLYLLYKFTFVEQRIALT